MSDLKSQIQGYKFTHQQIDENPKFWKDNPALVETMKDPVYEGGRLFHLAFIVDDKPAEVYMIIQRWDEIAELDVAENIIEQQLQKSAIEFINQTKG